MKTPLTYAISSGEATDPTFEADQLSLIDQAIMLAEHDVSFFQIREKRLSASNLYTLALDIIGALTGSRTRLLINDRADIAASVGAYGVHLASNSLPTELVRKCFGEKLAVFVSTHSADDIKKAVAAGADAVVFGPIFPTPGKSATVGIEGLKQALLQEKKIPMIVLGGIDSENCCSALQAGADGVAGIRAFADLTNVERLMKELNNCE